MFHPELQAMLARYDELVSSAEQGLMSVDDAMMTLASMVVVDAVGVEWRIDPSGQFVRAMPGSTPVLADPKMFTPASSVTGIPMPWSPSSPTPQQYEPYLQQPPTLPARAMEPQPPYGAPPVGVVPQPVIPQIKSRLPKVSLQPGKFRTIGVIAVCAAVALSIVSNRSGDTPVIDSSIVVESEAGAVGETPSQPDAPASQVISRRDAERVVEALSGKQSGAALAVSVEADSAMLAIAMPFAAAARLGYDVDVSSVTKSDTGAVATVEISFDGDLISTWSLALSVVDGRVRAQSPAVPS